jgi:hypothetical protein
MLEGDLCDAFHLTGTLTNIRPNRRKRQFRQPMPAEVVKAAPQRVMQAASKFTS